MDRISTTNDRSHHVAYTLHTHVYLVLEVRMASRGARRRDRRPALPVWWRRRPRWVGEEEDGPSRVGVLGAGLLSYGFNLGVQRVQRAQRGRKR